MPPVNQPAPIIFPQSTPQPMPTPAQSPIGTPNTYKNRATPTYMSSATFVPPAQVGRKSLMGQ